MTTTDKPSIAELSRYHRFKQDDGRGFGILRLDSIGSNQATIVDADLTEEAAGDRLTAYRREESKPSDPRPSIAELQMMHARDKFTDEAAIINAAPVLLEIAEAALELAGPSRPGEAHIPAWNALLAATAKVRP